MGHGVKTMAWPPECWRTTRGPCGLAFGGLHVDADAQVLDHDAAKIAGLSAAGEMVGGIFHFNYPSSPGPAVEPFGRDPPAPDDIVSTSWIVPVGEPERRRAVRKQHAKFPPYPHM